MLGFEEDLRVQPPPQRAHALLVRVSVRVRVRVGVRVRVRVVMPSPPPDLDGDAVVRLQCVEAAHERRGAAAAPG